MYVYEYDLGVDLFYSLLKSLRDAVHGQSIVTMVIYNVFTSMAILMRPSSVPLYFCTSFLIPAILRRELTTHSGLVRRTLIQPEQEVARLALYFMTSLVTASPATHANRRSLTAF